MVKPRKSIFNKPTDSTAFIAYWVVGIEFSSEFVVLMRGTLSVKGVSEITIPAAWVLACLTEPSIFIAVSITFLESWSFIVRFFISLDSSREVFILIPSLFGTNFASLSPKDKGKSKALVVSLMEARAPRVPNVTICATWSRP